MSWGVIRVILQFFFSENYKELAKTFGSTTPLLDFLKKTREDNSVAGDQFKTGELFVTKREVTEKFKRQSLPLPKIKKAFFEDLDPISDFPEKICFAFLDGDLYASIKTSLSLVQNKMQSGSVVIIHDYNNPELPGSARAVDEWLKNHRHQIKQFKTQETLVIITIK